MERYIFLDPDGTLDVGLLVIVAAKTGVVYADQCVGGATEVRELEGFLVPVGITGYGDIRTFDGTSSGRIFQRFFLKKFRGNPPVKCEEWTDEELAELEALVQDIPLWQTARDVMVDRHSILPRDERLFLTLDTARLDQLTEGWVPVKTVFGPGVLVFNNSD